MAVIKRFQGNQVFNQPVGVVRPSDTGVQQGQALRRLGTQMFEAAYETEVIKQKQIGRDYALNLVIRDQEDKLFIAEPPKNLSPVAQREAQPLLDKRYVSSLNVDMKERAATLRADFKNDPVGFDEAYSAYVEETVKVSGKYAAQAREIGATYAGQHTAALYAEKLEEEDRIDFLNDYENIRQQIDEIATYAGSNLVEVLTGKRKFEELTQEGGFIDQLQKDHGGRLGSTQITELKNLARSAYYGGQTIRIATSLDRLAEDNSPFVKRNVVTGHLRHMQDALRKGTVSSLPEAVQKSLARFGFDQAFLEQEGMGRVRNTLASNLSVIEGNLQEQYNAEFALNKNLIIESKVASEQYISSKESQTLLDAYGITNAYDLAGNLNNLLKPADKRTSTENLLHGLLFKQKGGLPQSAIDLLGDQQIIQDITSQDPEMIRPLLNMWRQVTTFNQGGYSNSTNRGLKPEAHLFWSTMEAYDNSVRTMNLEQFFAKKVEYDNLPKDRRNLLVNQQLTAGGYADMDAFIKENIDVESTDQLDFFSRYADELVYLHGTPKAEKIIKSSLDKVFVKSDFIFGKEKSRFAPELVYNNEDMQELEKAVMAQVLRASNINIEFADFGRTIFLKPDPREGPALPVYTIVDPDGMPLMSGSEVLQVGPQAILAARRLRTNQSIEELRAEALEEREQFLRFRASVDKSSDTTVGTIAGGRIDISEFE